MSTVYGAGRDHIARGAALPDRIGRLSDASFSQQPCDDSAHGVSSGEDSAAQSRYVRSPSRRASSF